MNRYSIGQAERADMRIRNFKWNSDEDNNVTLEWSWPADRAVRLMLVFGLEDGDDADAAALVAQGYAPTVVSRELSSKFTTLLEEPQKRYVICPAMFSEDKQIIALCPGLVTDVIYRKTRVQVKITEKAVNLSKFKKVSWQITTQGDVNAAAALGYALYEYGRLIDIYPLDEGILMGGAYLYLETQQEIRFMVNAEYAHLVHLISQTDTGG